MVRNKARRVCFLSDNSQIRLGSGTNHSILKTMSKTKISLQAWKKQRGRTAKKMDWKSEDRKWSLVAGSGYLMPLTSGN